MRLATILAAGALLLAACAAQPGAGSANPSANPSAATSSAGGVQITVSHTSAGDALAGPNGKTLYVFKADTNGSSTCTGDCATLWPALAGDGSTVVAGTGVSGTFGTTTRDDGTQQVTHNGQPLYYYAPDQAPGDAKGQGVGGVWFIAPVGTEAFGSPAAQPSTTPGGPGY